VVTAVEITDRAANDSPQLPPLVEKTANNFNIDDASGDKAYSSLENHEALAKIGAVPYIAFKKNATGAVGGAFEKMYRMFCVNRDEFLAHYHKRSNVESTFGMIKAKFGTKLRSKGERAQINEALCKVLCHNLCCLIQSMFEFGIVPQFAAV
jgi:transposase